MKNVRSVSGACVVAACGIGARLLGEDFAVFKTPRGRYGMLPEACPHRRASLAYGVVEGDGIRCPYHGWMFGVDGSCLDQPAEREETNFRERVRAVAGQVQELGGLIWAYIGPSPAPELAATSIR